MIDLSPVPDALRSKGVPVYEPSNWITDATYTRWWPIGVMVHGTGMTVPLPISNAQGNNRFGRPLCNFIVRSHVVQVDCVTAGYATDSGAGSGVVLDEVRRKVAPPDRAAQRGLNDTLSGNPYFIDIEVDHPNDGSPLTEEARIGLEALCRALVDLTEIEPVQIIDHAEWTRRKVDPLWEGVHSPDLRRIIGGESMFTDIQGLPQGTQDAINRLAAEGIVKGTSPTTFDPDGLVTRWQMALFLDRLRNTDPR